MKTGPVQFPIARANDDCRVATIQYNSGNLEFLNIGNNTVVAEFPTSTTASTVTATATDESGKMATCQFHVTVTDEGQSLTDFFLIYRILYHGISPWQ